MATTTPRLRRRETTRAAILDAAREIAARDGWQAVTVRKVAALIDYSPPVIYEHFASKNEILVELLRHGFRDLAARLQAAAGAKGPDDPLRRVARAYCAFAFEAPDLYQVMYGLGGAPFGVADTWQEGERIGEVAAAAVAAARPSANPEAVAEDVLVLWATLHGLVALAMAGRIAGGPEAVARLAERAVRTGASDA